MSEWQPIETAPKDGAEIDVWVVTRHAKNFTESDGRRLTNSAWVPGTKEGEPHAWRHWRSPYFEEIESESGGRADVITHWMPLPGPPLNASDACPIAAASGVTSKSSEGSIEAAPLSEGGES